MLLQGLNGTQFELNILGYQTPHDASNKYEANWLRMYCSLKQGSAVWSFTEKMLLTWEVQDFIQWLERFTRPGMNHGRIGFSENYLRFEAEQIADNLVCLRIDHENLQAQQSWELSAMMTIRQDAIPSCVNALREELGKYPVRQSG